jgi:hypothetical protein
VAAGMSDCMNGAYARCAVTRNSRWARILSISESRCCATPKSEQEVAEIWSKKRSSSRDNVVSRPAALGRLAHVCVVQSVDQEIRHFMSGDARQSLRFGRIPGTRLGRSSGNDDELPFLGEHVQLFSGRQSLPHSCSLCFRFDVAQHDRHCCLPHGNLHLPRTAYIPSQCRTATTTLAESETAPPQSTAHRTRADEFTQCFVPRRGCSIIWVWLFRCWISERLAS